jgi:serine protease DegQ
LILKVAGEIVSDVPEMLTRVAALRPGEAASLSLQRNGKLIEVRVTPGTRPIRP